MTYQKKGPKLRKFIIKNTQRLVLLAYIGIILKMTLIRGPLAELMDEWTYKTVLNKVQTANFYPLHTIKLYINILPSPVAILNLVGNIACFIPLGYLPPLVFQKHRGFFKTLLLGLSFILFIEITQLLTGLGEFDIDDIILNMLGAIIGALTYKALNPAKGKKSRH